MTPCRHDRDGYCGNQKDDRDIHSLISLGLSALGTMRTPDRAADSQALFQMSVLELTAMNPEARRCEAKGRRGGRDLHDLVTAPSVSAARAIVQVPPKLRRGRLAITGPSEGLLYGLFAPTGSCDHGLGVALKEVRFDGAVPA
jgi:hypothetical protein